MGLQVGITMVVFANYLMLFTEQGIYMLASILRTSIADAITVRIMRTFVVMKSYINNTLITQNSINSIISKHEQKFLKYDEHLEEHDEKISRIEKVFEKFDSKKQIHAIFFAGQIYDAYSKILDIMNEAKKELIVIDAYADKSVLDMISKLSIPVILIIKNRGNLTNLDIQKYKEQYDNLKVITTDESHDRFFVIDRDIIYHCGASINHAGSKTFAINLIADEIFQ